MALTQKQRDEKATAKRKAAGEKELRKRAREGTKTVLAELMQWHDLEEQGEAMTLALHHLHALGPERSRPFFTPPRHEITFSQKVARLLDHHRQKALRLCSDQLPEDDQ